jgi:cytochrome c-type biogenesis protein CcmH
MRDVIRTKLQAGVSEQQILDDFVAAYGPGILTNPAKQGVSLGVWIGPLAGVLIGVLLLAGIAPRWLRRGQRSGPSPASPRAPGVDSAVVDELRQYRERVGA